MNKLIESRVIILLVLLAYCLSLSSCAKKVYFFEAEKTSSEADLSRARDIRVESYFSGDALDYVVFEVDIFNNTNNDLIIDHKDISLSLINKDGKTVLLDALDKRDIIYQLEMTNRDIQREKKSRDISNAIGIGIGIIAIGTTSNYAGIDVALYATESAAYMMEDSRAHKLMVGSLEEQIAYVDEWVLERDTITPGKDNSWDVLFERRLADAPATLIVEIEGIEFKQAYNLYIIEEKVR